MPESEERRSYLMRKDEERCYLRYLFEVDGEEEVTRVELIPTIGNEHLVYARTGNGESLIQTWKRIYVIEPLPEFQGNTGREKYERLMEYLGSEENENRSHWEESEPTPVDKLGISDPIVRDAFNIGTTAEQLFVHYKLVKDSGERC